MPENLPQQMRSIAKRLTNFDDSPILQILGLRESKQSESLAKVTESVKRVKPEVNKTEKYSNSQYLDDLYNLLDANKELRGTIDMSVLKVQFDLIKNEPNFDQMNSRNRFLTVNKILSKYILSPEVQQNIYAYMDTQGVKVNNL